MFQNFGSILNLHIWVLETSAKKQVTMVVRRTYGSSARSTIKKLDPNVWGDGTVLNRDKLSKEDQLKNLKIYSARKSTKQKKRY
jgi:putative spermidine/putrescine transport system substrate-binding protein